jgi:hypothetical protein
MILAVIQCGLTVVCFGRIELTARAQDEARIAPASGGVELNEIHIARRSALGAARGADITNMQLGLCFAADWGPHDVGSPPLIHIQSLSPIEDDTGRLLSTEQRRNQIECLRGEVRGNAWRNAAEKGGQGGPVVTLVLDAPARGANKLKAIKGKAEVSMTKRVTVTFQDLAAVNGKDLDHPDMKGLAAMKLRFSIEAKDGRVSATLTAPVNYASPWNRGRLDSWDLMDGERRLRLPSLGTVGAGEGVTVEKEYRRRTFKDLSLRLVVLEPIETKTFSFDFQNVELP